MPEIRFTHAVVAGRLAATTLTLTEQRVAVIGANGSGKSTLARLINGLITPTAGTVTVDGHDTGSEGRLVRQLVGFVFTDPAAQVVMPTCVEDIELSLRRSVPSRDRREAALHVLERFGLNVLADRSVHALSGGQRQLLALAGVLASNPATIVADEPTTLLDLANTRRVGEELFNLDQQLILVTHDLELARKADRALVIAGGRIDFDGPAEEAVAHYVAHVSEQP